MRIATFLGILGLYHILGLLKVVQWVRPDRFRQDGRRPGLKGDFRRQRWVHQVASIGLALFWFAVFANTQSALHAAPIAQRLQDDGSHLYLIPSQTTGVALTMHNVQLRLAAREDATLALAVVAEYRLQNSTASPLQVALAVTSERPGTTLVQADGVVLAADGQPIGLEANQNGTFNSSVTIQADSSSNLVLQYQVLLRTADLTQVRYAPRTLDSWPGRPSLRLDILVPNVIDPASWVRVQPDTWSYASTSDTGMVDMKWLYDGLFPSEPFIVEFISPPLWAQIQSLSQATNSAPTIAAFEQLGTIYRRLLTRVDVEDVRNRFYAQAIAAYSAGLALPPTGDDTAVRTAQHIGLAVLYRNRTADTSGNLATEYAELLVAETTEALRLMDDNDPRARELRQWRADGLHVQLESAQLQHDWVTALQIVDELATLPVDSISLAGLEQVRKALRIQQALQLMEHGDRSGAEALAGSEIDDADLAPPTDLLAIFAGWQISVSAGLQGATIRATLVANEPRSAVAQTVLEQTVQDWQREIPNGLKSNGSFGVVLAEVESPLAGQRMWHLELTGLDEKSASQLAMLLPVDANWALLRTLLTQLAPNYTVDRRLLRDQVRMIQPLDLRPAGDQWAAMASTLQRRADEFEGQVAGVNSTEPAAAESLLQTQIRAANYRNAASAWANLGRQSWVLFAFELDGPLVFGSQGSQRSRSWYATVSTPNQILSFQTESVDPGRLVAILIGAILLLILLSGYLWWLL